MNKPRRSLVRPKSALPSDYAPLLAEIKARVQSARIKAGLAANRELLLTLARLSRTGPIIEDTARGAFGIQFTLVVASILCHFKNP